MSNVILRKACESDRLLIKNLFNLYQNDLSEYCSDFQYIDENGYFDEDASDGVLPYGDGVYPHIILCDGRLVGFVMYTDAQYALPGCEWRLEELYLIRPARKRGLAREAVKQIFDAHPGMWCLSVYPDNVPARKFWNSLIKHPVSEAPGENGMTDVVFTWLKGE